MKRIFTFLVAIGTTQLALTQCDPMAHDFQGAAFGVYPPDSIGLDTAYIDEPYNQFMYFKVPLTTADFGFALPTPINSVTLVNITYNNGVSDVPIEGLGLSIECSTADCVFLPGQQYCGVVSGVPNAAGTFNAKINVSVLTAVGAISYSFENYSLVILPSLEVHSIAGASGLRLEPAYPNPADNSAILPVSLTSNEKVEICVMNLVGDNVLSKSFSGTRGMNNIPLNLENFESGVYLITVKSGNHSATQKFVVE